MTIEISAASAATLDAMPSPFVAICTASPPGGGGGREQEHDRHDRERPGE